MLGCIAKYLHHCQFSFSACIDNLASHLSYHYDRRQIMRKIVKILSNEKERTSLHSSLFTIFSHYKM